MSTLQATRSQALNLKTAVFSLLLTTSIFSGVYPLPLFAENTQAELENSILDTDNLANMECAKARIAELYIQSSDANAKATTDLLASISRVNHRQYTIVPVTL